MSERLRDELAAMAPEIKSVEANLGTASKRYFELEIPSHAWRIGRELHDGCATCGRPNSFEFPPGAPVLRDLPAVPLFRLANQATAIIAREDVYSFIREKMGSFSSYQSVQLMS